MFDAKQILVDCQAILTGHFKLTSGLHSNRYVQCAQVFQYPNKVELLCKMLSNKLGEKAKGIQTVIGPAVGGIIFAYELARSLDARTIYAERVDEKMIFRRNFSLDEDERVIVVEDVVTTGGSAKEVGELAESVGAKVVAICSLVDRSAGQVQFKWSFVPLISLDVTTYQPDECPLCKAGMQLTQPGSRHLKL